MRRRRNRWGTCSMDIPMPPGEAKAAGLGGRTQSCGAPSNRPARSAASPLIFDAEFLELCSHSRKSALEDADDPVANLGRREGGAFYESTPTIDFILGADDHLIGITIHGDEALGLLDLLHQIIDGHGLVSIGGLSIEPWPPLKSIVTDVIGSRGEPVIYRARARRADPRSSDG